MSQKPHEPTDATRQRVSIMVASGIDQAGIASVLGIGEVQMRRHYKRELANGYASITARIAARQIAKADAGDERAIEFYLERRGGWVRQDNVAHSGKIDVRILTDEERDARIADLLRKTGFAGVT